MTIANDRTTDMENPILKKIADECGLYIDPHNLEVSYKEVEFFGERIVKAVIDEIEKLDYGSNDESDRTIRSVVQGLKEHFKLS